MNYDPDGNFNFGGFMDSVGSGWSEGGLFGAIGSGAGNIGENFGNMASGKGFKDNKEIYRKIDVSVSSKKATVLDGYDQKISIWDQKSNSKDSSIFKGSTPKGNYTVESIEKTNHSRMKGNDGVGWKARMKYDGKNWPSAREKGTFYFHPDTGNDGTYGCVGINPDQSTKFGLWMESYLKDSDSININVK